MLLLLPVPILLAVSLCFGLGNNISRKLYNKTAPSGRQSLWFFNAFMSLVCLVFITLYSIDPTAEVPLAKIADFSWASAGMGAVFGILVLVQTYTHMWALEIGPLSYTSVILSLATLISAVSGLFFGESIDILQYFGMGVMVLCIVFSIDRSKKDDKKSSIKWLIIALVSCVTDGLVGVMQKIHQNSEYKEQNVAFLISAFVFMAIASAVIWLVQRRKAKEKFKPDGKQTLLAGLCGAFLAVPHVANLFLAGALPSAVFFPIFSTGTLILTLIAAMVFFKDKLTKLQWAGIVLGIISSLLVSGTVSAWVL